MSSPASGATTVTTQVAVRPFQVTVMVAWSPAVALAATVTLNSLAVLTVATAGALLVAVRSSPVGMTTPESASFRTRSFVAPGRRLHSAGSTTIAATTVTVQVAVRASPPSGVYVAVMVAVPAVTPVTPMPLIVT